MCLTAGAAVAASTVTTILWLPELALGEYLRGHDRLLPLVLFVAGPIGMGVATAIGLFDCLESVAMVPTHVWDAVPGDVVTSAILAAAAATSAGLKINEYKDSRIGSNADPMIVHAGTSTTYPISFVEAAYAGNEFIKNNPPVSEHSFCNLARVLSVHVFCLLFALTNAA